MKTNKILNELIKIPTFIKNTDTLHYAIWNRMRDANDILYHIATSPVLSLVAIEVSIIKFDRIIDDIAFCMNGDDFYDIIKYYSSITEFVLIELLEEEMYEGMENFKNFNTNYLEHINNK